MTSLDNYFALLADIDEKIRVVLTKCGLDRRTTANDRLLYKTWTETWNMPLELINYAAELAAGTASPIAYVNRVLSDWKQRGVTTIEQAKLNKTSEKSVAATSASFVGGTPIERRHYTDEQLNALFSALDEEE